MLTAYLIPGLAMASNEFEDLPGLYRADNPEVLGAPALEGLSSLKEIAEYHLARIQKLITTSSLNLIGMSMGGMILSILASQFREELPRETRFLYLVTSPNLSTNPALPDPLVKEWFQVKPGDVEGFERILMPFFSPHFRSTQPEKVKDYIQYRASGKNGQSSQAFVRQLRAITNFSGESSFSRLNPSESTFVGGADDTILGPSHSRDLRKLCPRANHFEISELGHMVNMEQPQIIERWLRHAL